MSMFSNGLSGLNASQIALNTISNNVANVNVAGYSRLDAISGSRYSPSNSNLSTGQGVEITSVRRVADTYLNNSLWRSNSSYGFSASYSNYLTMTEKLVANENLSIAKGLDGLFSAIDSATTEPSTMAPRQQIIASADALTNRFNSLYSNLDIQSTDISEQVKGMMNSANTMFAQVAVLNKKIVESSATGGNVSALQDQRAETIGQLAGLMDLDVSRLSDGSITLSLSGGQPVVMGASAATLSSTGTGYTVSIARQNFTFDGEVGGKIGGILSYKTNVLDPTKAKLDQIGKDTADSMNKQLVLGQDINDPVGAGKPLFSYDPSNPAGSLKVSDGFKAKDLALGAVGVGPGDNTNLTALLKLKGGLLGTYNALVGDIAIQSGEAISSAKASKSVAQNALTQRDSVSGVNLDEEGVSLIKYQKTYNANAKVISMADKLFSTLLMMM
jgi:flagellar hook-associated protein 1 FlgK